MLVYFMIVYHKKKIKMDKTVLCYLFKGDEVLLLYRNKKKNDINQGKWIGVGGHIEKGESPEEALNREVKEETGLTLKNYSKKGLLYFVNGNYEEVIYLYSSSSFIGELKECDEGELKYFPKNQIFDLPMWEADKIFLKYLLSNEPYFELKLIYEGDSLLSIERMK